MLLANVEPQDARDAGLRALRRDVQGLAPVLRGPVCNPTLMRAEMARTTERGASLGLHSVGHRRPRRRHRPRGLSY